MGLLKNQIVEGKQVFLSPVLCDIRFICQMVAGRVDDRDPC